ncbi:MAG: hypothetical protein ASARMPRED_001868 [Alectoria sarmentosa]|nr:MAG: hypothetical protein ASARMPRED_001868 [Alectoria sarmentosa]
MHTVRVQIGPIVRVTPDEVHVKDPEWSHVLYAGQGHIRDKDPSLAHAAGSADGTFGTVSHHVHRRRRVPVSSYFSKISVAEMQDKIWERVGHMCDVLREYHRDMIKVAEKYFQEHAVMSNSEERSRDATSYRARGGSHTLFHTLLASDLPANEKLSKRIAQEGFETLLAGSDPTARAMGVAVYHILANPDVANRLRKELEGVLPSPHDVVDLKVLENLPWLNSCIKEALRIGKVTDHRLSLIATEEDLQYKQWLMPAGTRISMNPTRNSYDPRFFPAPMKYTPERWLQSSEEHLAAMNHVFMPFAAGKRGCLGMHFARAELQIGLARMFRQFEFELFDTVRERDIDHTWAHISGEPNKKGKGLRFKVVKCL